MANKSRKISANKNTKMKQKNNETIISNNELKNLLKVTLIICGVLLVFYFITVLVQKNNNNTDNSDNNVAVIQYDKILVGEILNRKEKEYYVLIEKKNDSYVELYKQYLNNLDKAKYYTVDLSDVFNQNNIGEETIVDGNDVQNYKFNETTLLKVNNGSLIEAYKNKESIIEYLKNYK